MNQFIDLLKTNHVFFTHFNKISDLYSFWCHSVCSKGTAHINMCTLTSTLVIQTNGTEVLYSNKQYNTVFTPTETTDSKEVALMLTLLIYTPF